MFTKLNLLNAAVKNQPKTSKLKSISKYQLLIPISFVKISFFILHFEAGETQFTYVVLFAIAK